MKKINFIIIIIILFMNINTIHSEAVNITTDSTKVTLASSKKDKSSKKTDDEYLWPKGPSVVAESAILMEASTGTILYEKNIHDSYYPASITKIMTTLVALENSNLDELVTYSKSAIYGIERDSSHIWLDIGETITMEQSLYAIMLESANEAAYGVAEHVAGSLDAFVQLMNDKAISLGCTDTNFVNANGLHNDDHYTSAYDMALISQAALKNNAFRTITSTRSYQIPPTNKQSSIRYLVNHHKMALTSKYANARPYEGCIGGKTGYTSKAKNTLVTFAKRGKLELICVVLKSDSANVYDDTKLLLDYGFNNYTLYNISEEEAPFNTESNFLRQYNLMLNDATSPIQLNKSGNIVIPKNAHYSDAIKTVNFNTNATSSSNNLIIGNISFVYGNKEVGSTIIEYIPPSYKSKTGTMKVNRSTTASPLLEKFYNKLENDGTSNPEPIQKNVSKKDLKPIIIIIIVALLIGIYVIYYFVTDLPRLKKRKLYYNKKRLKSKDTYNNFFD